MIRRHTTEEVDLEKVRHDLENNLEDPELAENNMYTGGFSDLDFQIQYTENGRYTATSEKYTIQITEEEAALEVRTAEKTGEKEGEDLFETSEYRFRAGTAELPDRSIGGRETNPIDSALRSYARELYPEENKPGAEDAWELNHPPAERK